MNFGVSQSWCHLNDEGFCIHGYLSVNVFLKMLVRLLWHVVLHKKLWKHVCLCWSCHESPEWRNHRLAEYFYSFGKFLDNSHLKALKICWRQYGTNHQAWFHGRKKSLLAKLFQLLDRRTCASGCIRVPSDETIKKLFNNIFCDFITSRVFIAVS